MEGIKRLSNFKNLIGELQVTYKRTTKPSVKVTSSAIAHEAINPSFKKDMDNVELFYIMCLTRDNHIAHIDQVSQGGQSNCMVDPRVLFRLALATKCNSIILAHNHPSGNLKASEADLRITKKIKEGGELLDIKVLDHLILTSEGYTSLNDEGLM